MPRSFSLSSKRTLYAAKGAALPSMRDGGAARRGGTELTSRPAATVTSSEPGLRPTLAALISRRPAAVPGETPKSITGSGREKRPRGRRKPHQLTVRLAPADFSRLESYVRAANHTYQSVLEAATILHIGCDDGTAGRGTRHLRLVHSLGTPGDAGTAQSGERAATAATARGRVPFRIISGQGGLETKRSGR